MTASKDAKRTRKRREMRTAGEVKAFKFGVQTTREAIGPDIWKRAVIRGGLWGFVVGVCTGGAFVHYFG